MDVNPKVLARSVHLQTVSVLVCLWQAGTTHFLMLVADATNDRSSP